MSFFVSCRKNFAIFLFIAFSFNNYQSINSKPIERDWVEKAERILLPLVSVCLQIWLINKLMEEPNFKVYKPGEIKEKFNNIAGNHEAKEALTDIVEYLKNPDTYKEIGAKPTTGILLTGAPGTGKTLLARALAGEANCAFIYASGAEFQTKFVGSGAARVKKIFDQARQQRDSSFKKTPCIIFIDEIEILATQRGSGNNYNDQTVNELLTQLDGFVKTQGHPVIVIAATNFPEKLDAAVTRPGRIDRTIFVENPDLQDRIDILQIHLNKVKHASGLNLHSVAQRTIGFTGAELAEVIHTAARIAVNRKASLVEQKDLEEALDLRTIGVASSRALTEKERKIVAYHEAGHALINMLTMSDSRFVNKITIQPRGSALGVTHTVFKEELAKLYTKDDFSNMIAMLLGGKAAEDIIFNIVSTGPSSDLEQATLCSIDMIKFYGMGSGLAVESAKTKLSSRKLETEVNEILQRQYDRTKQLLIDHIDKLHILANALLEKETLFKADIEALCLF